MKFTGSSPSPLAVSTVLLVFIVVVALSSMQVAPQPVAGSAEMLALTGPPERPSSFKNQDEVKEYLRALNDYFSVVGRPRFGRKRSAPFHSESKYAWLPVEYESLD